MEGYPKEGGKLGCLRLNNMQEFYMEIILRVSNQVAFEAT